MMNFAKWLGFNAAHPDDEYALPDYCSQKHVRAVQAWEDKDAFFFLVDFVDRTGLREMSEEEFFSDSRVYTHPKTCRILKDSEGYWALDVEYCESYKQPVHEWLSNAQPLDPETGEPLDIPSDVPPWFSDEPPWVEFFPEKEEVHIFGRNKACALIEIRRKNHDTGEMEPINPEMGKVMSREERDNRYATLNRRDE